MSFIESINRIFSDKPRAFFINEGSENCKKEIDIVKSMNFDVDKFSTFNKLLYTLRSNSRGKYNVGIIHENGSKYSPQILSTFIKQIDPTIKIIVYKNEYDLKKESQLLI